MGGGECTGPRTSSFAAPPCSATLERIIKLCEAYQNADVEGKDEEDIVDNADLVINQICEIACVEHASLQSKLQNSAIGRPDATKGL